MAIISQLGFDEGLSQADKRVVFSDSILVAVHDLLAGSNKETLSSAFSLPVLATILPLVLVHGSAIASASSSSALQLLATVQRPPVPWRLTRAR